MTYMLVAFLVYVIPFALAVGGIFVLIGMSAVANSLPDQPAKPDRKTAPSRIRQQPSPALRLTTQGGGY